MNAGKSERMADNVMCLHCPPVLRRKISLKGSTIILVNDLCQARSPFLSGGPWEWDNSCKPPESKHVFLQAKLFSFMTLCVFISLFTQEFTEFIFGHFIPVSAVSQLFSQGVLLTLRSEYLNDEAQAT